jgi:hypothetical protein
MNPLEARPQVTDKAWATAVLDAASLPTSRTLGIIALGEAPAPATAPYPVFRSDQDVKAMLASSPADGVVIKPVRGGGGEGVMVFRAADARELVALNGDVLPLSRLLETLRAGPEPWKVEARIPQHLELAKIAGDTLSTVRMLAFRTRDDAVHLGPATWKITADSVGVDHFMHGPGRYAAPIDPATGRLGGARRWAALSAIDVHPVSGLPIRGTVLPYWKEAQELVRRAAACFPMIWAPAFDVGISANGPVIVELNVNWAEHLTQAPGPVGLVAGRFRQFLEERGCGRVVNLAARDRHPVG